MLSNRRFVLGLMLVVLMILAACNGDDQSSDENSSNEQIRRFNWDKSADIILFRMDEIPQEESEAQIANRIPLCTIWGDGRLVWVNHLRDENEILEARLSDEEIRDFVEDVIGYGFYSWEEDLVPPDQRNIERRIITLNLYDNARTVERYQAWPNQSFDRIFEQCSSLSAPAHISLEGGFVRAYPVEDPIPSVRSMEWGRGAPFRMADVAASGSPVWLDEPYYLEELWTALRQIGPMYVTELGDYYEVVLEVPGISRNAPPTEVVPTSDE